MHNEFELCESPKLSKTACNRMNINMYMRIKMINFIGKKILKKFHNQYDYDVNYMQDILHTNRAAFLKFLGFQAMSTHAKNLPQEALYAAKLRAIIWDDCGPCTQLITDMAIQASVKPQHVKAIISRDQKKLSSETWLVIQFTEAVLAHNPEIDHLRQSIIDLWGMDGLISIAFSISTSRVYPALKYALGYGKECQLIRIKESSLVPVNAK